MKEPFFTIDERIETLCRQAEEQCAGIFRQIDDTADYNAQKVLAAFIKNRVSEPMFAGTTGYGYGDRGRETLDALFARIMGTEDALVRHSIVSGTHAITIALFGVLRPGDTLLVLVDQEAGLVVSKPEVLQDVAANILRNLNKGETEK